MAQVSWVGPEVSSVAGQSFLAASYHAYISLLPLARRPLGMYRS